MSNVFCDPTFWTIALFLIPLFLNVPIAMSLAGASIFLIWVCDFGIMMLPYNFFASIAKFTMLSIPFFILAGGLMEKSGIASRLIKFINSLTSNFTGGLAIGAIIIAAFWGALSGVAVATVAALGPILVPGMVRNGYDKAFSTAAICVSAGLSVIIPPSITFIIYAVISGVSVGTIFISGILPGLVITGILILSAVFSCKKHGYGTKYKTTGKEIWSSFKESVWAIMMPLIVLGGIYGGVFTPTEAAVVAVVYALFVGSVIYKQLTFKDIYDCFCSTVQSTSVVMLIVACAGLYSLIGATVGLVEKSSSFVLGLSNNQYVVLLLINIVLLIAGMLLDGTSIMYVFMPLMLPIIQHFHWNLIWFGVLLTLNLAIGSITPPVAVCLYVGTKVSDLTMEELIPPVIPLLIAMLIALFVLAMFPQITLIVPELLGLA